MTEPSRQPFIAWGRLHKTLYRFGTQTLPAVRREEVRIRRWTGGKPRRYRFHRSGR